MKIDLRLQHQLLAVETEHHVNAMVELVAPDVPEDSQSAPLRVALVVDRSGSMAGEKLRTTKRCAAYLASRMRATDELALVTYDDEVRLLAALAPVEADAFQTKVASITPGGMTNLSGGWLKGVEELHRRDDGVRRVLLLTDGIANVGICDVETLVEMATTAACGGIGTSTIGFGDGFNEDLLTEMADAAGGNARYAASAEDAPGIFADEFDGLVELTAQNVSVEIRPAEDVGMIGVLNDYPATEVPGGVQIAVGDAYAGQELRVVFQLTVPGLAGLGVTKIADVVVRYADVTDGVATKTVTHPLLVNLVSADEAAAAPSDPIVDEEVLVLSAAQRITEAQRLADEGAFDRAREVLSDAAATLRSTAVRSQRADELLATASELEAVATEFEGDTLTPSSRKRMHYTSQDIRRRKRPGSSSGRPAS